MLWFFFFVSQGIVAQRSPPVSVMAASPAQVPGPSQARGETAPRHRSRHEVLVERPQGRPAGSRGPAPCARMAHGGCKGKGAGRNLLKRLQKLGWRGDRHWGILTVGWAPALVGPAAASGQATSPWAIGTPPQPPPWWPRWHRPRTRSQSARHEPSLLLSPTGILHPLEPCVSLASCWVYHGSTQLALR